MTYELLQVERSGHIATITLNRPDVLNALSSDLARELHQALDEVAPEWPDIRVVIITGAGRGFCSGADVGAQAQGLSQESTGQRQQSRQTSSETSIVALAPHIRSIPQPVIAAVNGVAVGAGCSITLASDIRIASEAARFALIFVKRSLVPDTGSAYTSVQIAGMGVAMEMALTGHVYDAQWALQKGLVSRVVPGDQLMDEARAVAEEIAGNPPLCVKSIKQLMYSFGVKMGDVLSAEHNANEPSTGSEDRREAVMSFVEKRAPVYHGR